MPCCGVKCRSGIALSFRYDRFVTQGHLDVTLCTRHEPLMLIYKIFRDTEWAQLLDAGVTKGAPIDLADGYIHFSSAQTVEKTAALYFADIKDLVLVAVEADNLDALKWEPSRGGELFPHLFRDLTLADVVWSRPLPIVNGVHQFGDLA